MKVLNLSAGCECAGTLGIGYRGENDRTEVRFDFSAWAEEFGAPGAVELFVRRQGDTDAYPIALTIDGSEAVWTVSSVDTAVEGLGEAEFVWLLNGVVAKTAVWGTYVAPDIGQPTDEPPDPYESWMEALGEMAADTLINAQRAETAQTGAEAAEAAAEAAQAAAETAQGSAEDAQAAAEVAQRKAESAQDAAEAAQAAAETAQGIAQSSAQSAAAAAASAQTSATAAAASESAAEAAQEAAEASAASANSSADAAAQSSTAAAASAGAAAASETAADTSATAAAASESAAEAAQAAAEAVLESIPEDYSAMSADVAELKSDRDQLEGIDTALNGDNIITVTDFSGAKAVNGATAAYADGKLVMYGTCSGLRRYVCLDGQNFVATTGTAFAQTLRPGKYRVHISATGSYTGTHRLAATANTFSSGVSYYGDGDVINTNVGLMVGYQVNANADFGTSENPTYIDIRIECFEAKAGAREHDLLDGAFLSASTKETANALTWEMGTIATATGEDSSSSEKIRTVGFFDVTDAVALRAATGYEFVLYAYDRVTGDYVGNLKKDGVFDKTRSRLLYATDYYYLEPQLKYRAILRNADGSTTIAPSAGANLLFVRSRIDETLTQQGQAADAAATGAAIMKIEDFTGTAIGYSTRGLPEGYTEKYAIETPGSSLIDTGINMNVHVRAVIDVMSTGGNVFGVWHTNTQREYGGPGTNFMIGGTTCAAASATAAWIGKRCLIDFSDTRLIIDGTTVATYDATAEDVTINGTFRLLGVSDTYTHYATAGTRIYGAKFYKIVSGVETLVFDAVPCVRDSDSAVGFYDLVGGAFHGAEAGSPTAVQFPNLVDVEERTTALETDIGTAEAAIKRLEEVSEYAYINFINGAIDNTTGAIANGTKTVRTDYIDIDTLYSAYVDSPCRLNVYKYDADCGYISYSYVGNKIDYADILAIKTATPTVKYVKLVYGGSTTPVRESTLTTYHVSIKQLKNKLEEQTLWRITGKTATTGFIVPIQMTDSVRNKSMIVAMESSYTGTQPKIYFAVTWKTSDNGTRTFYSAYYPIGTANNTMLNEWRVPTWLSPISDHVLAIINIPEGSTLTIKSAWNYYSDAARAADGDLIVQAHSQSGFGAPHNTIAQFEGAAKLGFKYCIAIPKVTSDGVYVCLHDDDSIQATARNDDGTAIADEYKDHPVSYFTYDQLLQFDFGIYRGMPFAGQRIPTLADIFKICARTGMHPVLSVHPSLDGHWANIKALAKKYGVLGTLNIKAPVSMLPYPMAELKNDIESYAVVKSSSVTVSACISNLASMIETNGITVPCGVEAPTGDLTETAVGNILAAGFFAAANRYDNDEYSTVRALIELGVTRFTDDYNCSVGLNW